MNYKAFLLFLCTILYGDIHVFNRSAGTETEIKTLSINSDDISLVFSGNFLYRLDLINPLPLYP